MSTSEVGTILRKLDKIDERVRDLESSTVTWKTLLLVVGTMAASITAVVTLGNQLWGG